MPVRVSHLTNIPSFRGAECRAQFSAKPGDQSTGLEGNLVDGGSQENQAILFTKNSRNIQEIGKT